MRKLPVVRSRMTAAMLAIIASLSGCASLAPWGPTPETRKTPYPVVFAQTAPVIDGKLDDAVWKRAILVEPFYEYKKINVRLDFVKAWLAWDAEYLYYAIEVKDEDIYVSETDRDAVLCQADVAELFIKPSDQALDVYEFEFNVWGAIWDLHFASRGAGSDQRCGDAFNADIRCAGDHQGTINNWNDKDKGYTIEVAIPLSAFSRAAPGGPSAGDVWRFNVAGYDFNAYKPDCVLFTCVDNNTKGFKEYELYPKMIFLPPSGE